MDSILSIASLESKNHMNADGRTRLWMAFGFWTFYVSDLDKQYWNDKPHKRDVRQTVPAHKTHSCHTLTIVSHWGSRSKKVQEKFVTYQVNDKTCKMQNNNASPKFFHCKKHKTAIKEWTYTISFTYLCTIKKIFVNIGLKLVITVFSLH